MTGERCGTVRGYRDHITDSTEKCAPCRKAHAADRANYRRRRYLNRVPLKVDATGTRRRIQALAAIGWPLQVQSVRLGWKRSTTYAVASRSWVWPETAEKVRGLYDELSMIPGPSKRVAGEARRKGWPVPLAWDDASIDDPAASPASTRDIDSVDELAVEAVLEGVRLQLAGATAHAAVRALHARGVPAAVVAERIGIQERQVERLKARDTAPHRKVNNYLGETA